MIENNVPRISGLSQIAKNYDAIFCDVWGVLHNGVSHWTAAASALAQFRDEGGVVIMITNAPKPAPPVIEQMNIIGVPSDGVYDAVVTSGDATRGLIKQIDGPVFFLGPDRDRILFDGLQLVFADIEHATAVVCTGLFDDETETAADYVETLAKIYAHKLPFICANPDIVVERGERKVFCAGALARDYEKLGGEVRIVGKPHKPIYDKVVEKLATITGIQPENTRILAIGDGILTDVKGAIDYGLDLLFVSAGIHADEYGDQENPDDGKLQDFLKLHKSEPVAYLPRLIW